MSKNNKYYIIVDEEAHDIISREKLRRQWEGDDSVTMKDLASSIIKKEYTPRK